MVKTTTATVVVCALLTLACTPPTEQAKTEPLKSGLIMEDFDTTASPTGDFYRFVNGKWLDNNEIPADKAMISSFTTLADLNKEQLRAIIEEAGAKEGAPKNSPEQQVGDFFKSYMNTELLNTKGIEPIQPLLDKVDAVKTREDLVALYNDLNRLGVRPAFSTFISVDAQDATQYIVYMSQGGTSLPDRDYYLADNDKMKAVREAYVAYVSKIFEMAKDPNPAAKAQTVMELETRLAQAQWTRVQSRDSNKTYNRFTQAKLDSEFPGFPWSTFFKSAQAGDSHIVARQPDFFKAFGAMFTEVSVSDWQTLARWNVLNYFASLLSQDFQDTRFDFYGKVLSGQQEQQPRWKLAVSAENQVLDELVGKVYVERHFRPEAKERMKELVANLKATFGERLDQLDWMSPETKKEAHAKLATFKAKIGYPDKWRDYSNLDIQKDDLVGNYIRANEANYDRNWGRLGGPIDEDEWGMPPQTVNAYYSPTRNEIVFPAAILQPPFFDMEADDAANYGGIGAVIGHEITHGFDDQGRKYDGEGNLRDWWSESDGEIFDKRANLMVEQYNAFKPLPDMSVNGQLTLGENIADLGGLTMAYYAYKRSLDGKPSPVIDGYTGEQRIFLAWGQVWRRKYREEALRSRLASDTHSPGYCRAVGPLRNMPEFYEAFNVKEGDEMYRSEDIRIKIW